MSKFAGGTYSGKFAGGTCRGRPVLVTSTGILLSDPKLRGRSSATKVEECAGYRDGSLLSTWGQVGVLFSRAVTEEYKGTRW